MKKLLLLLLCCVLLLTACAFASAEVSLTSINVGKADCHLLTLGEQVFMIDTGSAESWGMVSRALKILGIDHLNGVILTHTDKVVQFRLLHGCKGKKAPCREGRRAAWSAGAMAASRRHDPGRSIHAASACSVLAG